MENREDHRRKGKEMNRDLDIPAEDETEEIELSPEEVELIEQEIARREEIMNNIVQASLNDEPATVHRFFDEEIKHRLSDMLDDYKITLAHNLVGVPNEDEEEADLTNEEVEFLDAVVNLTEEEVEEIMNDPEIGDDDKELIQQIIDAVNQESETEDEIEEVRE